MVRSSRFIGEWKDNVNGKLEEYVKNTLVGTWDDAAADLTLPTNGLLVDAGGITVTAGGLTITADGITVTAGDLDMTNGTILNVGGSANDWTATAFAVSGANAGAINTITVLNSANDSGAGAAVNVTAGGSSASADAVTRYTETSGHIMTVGVDTSGSIGVMAMNTLLGSADGDIIRITDATPPVITYNAVSPTGTFDYVCESCGAHGGQMFNCCGEVAWHDDVAALIPVLKEAGLERLTGNEPGIQHLAKIGVMEVTPSDFPGEEGINWVGIRLDKAQWYTWSAMQQMYQKINEMNSRLELVEA